MNIPNVASSYENTRNNLFSSLIVERYDTTKLMQRQEPALSLKQ